MKEILLHAAVALAANVLTVAAIGALLARRAQRLGEMIDRLGQKALGEEDWEDRLEPLVERLLTGIVSGLNKDR